MTLAMLVRRPSRPIPFLLPPKDRPYLLRFACQGGARAWALPSTYMSCAFVAMALHALFLRILGRDCRAGAIRRDTLRSSGRSLENDGKGLYSSECSGGRTDMTAARVQLAPIRRQLRRCRVNVRTGLMPLSFSLSISEKAPEAGNHDERSVDIRCHERWARAATPRLLWNFAHTLTRLQTVVRPSRARAFGDLKDGLSS